VDQAYDEDVVYYNPSDKKWLSVYACIAALNKRLTHVEPDTDRIKDLESTVEQLQEQVAELEQWKPANTREHIIHLLTTTEKTQREIADELEVSESWVSRVKNEL